MKSGRQVKLNWLSAIKRRHTGDPENLDTPTAVVLNPFMYVDPLVTPALPVSSPVCDVLGLVLTKPALQAPDEPVTEQRLIRHPSFRLILVQPTMSGAVPPVQRMTPSLILVR